VAFDRFHGPRGIPRPARQVLKSALAVRVKDAFAVPGPLLAHPETQVEAIDLVGLGDSGVTLAFDVAQEMAETLLPTIGECVPGPARRLLESPLALGVEGAVFMFTALCIDPHTEPVAIERPPAWAARRSARFACACVLMPSVANARARDEKSSKSVPISTRQTPPTRRAGGHCSCRLAIVTSTERPASWLRANEPGRATQSGFGTASNILTCTSCGR
jgi:hypothetical protein